MRILVTGGAGYIGSETVRLLAQRGHRPLTLDTLERGHRAALDGTPLVVGSVADEALVERTLREGRIEAVIHFAALKSVEASFVDPVAYFGTNVGGTLALLAAMARAGVPWLVYSSSCAVYGTPAELPVRETSPLHPENPYGETKLLVERILPHFEAAGIRSLSLRYFNAAGAALDGRHGEDWTDASNLVPVVIRAALHRGPPVKVLGTDYPTPDGTAIRDYVHVVDLAEAHVRAVEALADGLGSATLNLGTGKGSSVRQVIDEVAAAVGRPVPVVDTDRRAGDPAMIWADAGLAETTIGWRARYGLAEIVATATRWHAAHPEGYTGTEAPEAEPARASGAGTPDGR